MNLSGHQSARMGSDTWLTPPEWIEKLGPFDLDPCCPPDMPWPTADLMLTEREDGLSCEWSKERRVWLNPPFGQQAIKWLRKLILHGNGIALIPARTETAMYYECVWGRANAVCFVRGRPHFHYQDGRRAPFNSGAPISLVAYGRENHEALLRAGLGITLSVRQAQVAVEVARMEAALERVIKRTNQCDSYEQDSDLCANCGGIHAGRVRR